MNILIIGSGAREHAIVTALKRSQQQPAIFCCGTTINPGIKDNALQYWCGDITDINTITKLACKWKINIAIIGPEAPLEKGLADILWQQNIPTIGPKKHLAQIETSKAFARKLMCKYNIPGLPKYKCFQDLNGIEDFLVELGSENYVVKANGLMSGKGVKIAGEHLFSFTDALNDCQKILAANQSLVIEEKLLGQEFSLMCFCDGENIVPMPIVQDHKRAFVGDKGPNTGGMGSYSDTDHRLPFLTEKDVNDALSINKLVVQALSKECNDKYIGILYGSFIATRTGVYVIEFNARFGDPEALNVLSILESDFVAIVQTLIAGNLKSIDIKFSNLATVCKYAVPKGYPDRPVKDVVIDIASVCEQAQLYLASVHFHQGRLLAMGSRTAACVGVASTLKEAEAIAEKAIRHINGPFFHREDIGTAKLIQERIDSMQRLRAI